MGSYCDKLLYGQLLLKPQGDAMRFEPRTTNGRVLEDAMLSPVAAPAAAKR